MRDVVNPGDQGDRTVFANPEMCRRLRRRLHLFPPGGPLGFAYHPAFQFFLDVLGFAPSATVSQRQRHQLQGRFADPRLDLFRTIPGQRGEAVIRQPLQRIHQRPTHPVLRTAPEIDYQSLAAILFGLHFSDAKRMVLNHVSWLQVPASHVPPPAFNTGFPLF